MKYAQEWNRQIGANSARFLLFFLICIFFLYQFFIFGQLRAAKYTREAGGYLKKAQALENQGMLVEQIILYKRAIRLLARASKSNPLDASVYFNFAESINSKIIQDEQWCKALDLKYLDLVTRDRNISLIELARRNYAAALKLNPTNAIYHQRLASIYEKLSNDEQAEKELKKAVMLDPQNVSIHLYLTQYYLSRNRQDEFHRQLARVVELYKLSLAGGGPVVHLKSMVEDYLRSINKEELIKQ
jgi:tetratricopeptide (TPR) repeat protein